MLQFMSVDVILNMVVGLLTSCQQPFWKCVSSSSVCGLLCGQDISSLSGRHMQASQNMKWQHCLSVKAHSTPAVHQVREPGIADNHREAQIDIGQCETQPQCIAPGGTVPSHPSVPEIVLHSFTALVLVHHSSQYCIFLSHCTENSTTLTHIQSSGTGTLPQLVLQLHCTESSATFTHSSGTLPQLVLYCLIPLHLNRATLTHRSGIGTSLQLVLYRFIPLYLKQYYIHSQLWYCTFSSHCT